MVFRYNHSQDTSSWCSRYEAYVSGEFVSVPNGTASGTLPPSGNPPAAVAAGAVAAGAVAAADRGARAHQGPDVEADPEPDPQAQPDADREADCDSDSAADAHVGPNDELDPIPTKLATTAVPPPPSRPPCRRSSRPTATILPTDLPTTILSPILDLADAIVQSTLKGLIDNPLNNNDAFDQCVANLTGN